MDPMIEDTLQLFLPQDLVTNIKSFDILYYTDESQLDKLVIANIKYEYINIITSEIIPVDMDFSIIDGSFHRTFIIGTPFDQLKLNLSCPIIITYQQNWRKFTINATGGSAQNEYYVMSDNAWRIQFRILISDGGTFIGLTELAFSAVKDRFKEITLVGERRKFFKDLKKYNTIFNLE
jgi:hypothetical protein